MRTFIIRPGPKDQDARHMWVVVAVEADGTEMDVGIYPTMAAAEAAKVTLERQDVDIRS